MNPQTTAANTHAEAARERRDIASGEVMPESRLIRFVAASDGALVPDLARKLPGRGMWVEARRESLDAATKRGAFSRAAKRQISPPPDLADQVERLMVRRLASALGLARRAGDLTFGFEKAASAIEAGKASWMIEAVDGAPDGRRKLLQISRRCGTPPRLLGLFSSDEMGLALGAGPVVHSVFLVGRSSERWTEDVEKLSGFRPLFPESWREGSVGGRSE